jgi:hypothetical protein
MFRGAPKGHEGLIRIIEPPGKREGTKVIIDTSDLYPMAFIRCMVGGVLWEYNL